MRRKTSVYLEERHSRRLSELARREGISEAEVLRRAIIAYAPEGAGDRDFVGARSGVGPGDSVADVPEDELLTGFGE